MSNFVFNPSLLSPTVLLVGHFGLKPSVREAWELFTTIQKDMLGGENLRALAGGHKSTAAWERIMGSNSAWLD